MNNYQKYAHIIIGDYMQFLTVLFRSVFFYALVMLMYRLMGKREIGELSVMDFIVSIFMAEMVAISIENYQSSIWLSVIPILIIMILQVIGSKLSLKSSKARKLLDGESSVIINRGKVNFKEMLKQRYNLDDLLTQLRSKSIRSIEEVDYAILETSGKLSVFTKSESSEYPLPLIMDGKIEDETLLQIRKSRGWLDKQLTEKNIRLENVFYAFFRNNELFIIEKDKII